MPFSGSDSGSDLTRCSTTEHDLGYGAFSKPTHEATLERSECLAPHHSGFPQEKGGQGRPQPQILST